MSQLHNMQINQIDYYLVIDTQTNTVYETFRTKTAAGFAFLVASAFLV